MTARELITEFILQGIKQDDLVEIQTTETIKPYVGYILDKDVFPPLPLSMQIQNALNKLDFQQIKVVRISLKDDGTNRSVQINNLLSLSMPFFPIRKDIAVTVITSIKKLETEEEQ